MLSLWLLQFHKENYGQALFLQLSGLFRGTQMHWAGVNHGSFMAASSSSVPLRGREGLSSGEGQANSSQGAGRGDTHAAGRWQQPQPAFNALHREWGGESHYDGRFQRGNSNGTSGCPGKGPAPLYFWIRNPSENS